MESALVSRVRAALWGLYVFDALSMPVHWYYDTGLLKRDFGYITSYQAPKAIHPGPLSSWQKNLLSS
jgi:ADP-ribosyl-[dinitrogen reductase] hydrolase